MEDMEAAFAAAGGYHTCTDKGDQHTACLNTLDCVGALGPDMRLGNV